MDDKFQTNERLLKEEKSDRITNDDRIAEKLEASETGGLHISAMGLIWLVSGASLTIFPNEIAKMLQWL